MERGKRHGVRVFTGRAPQLPTFFGDVSTFRPEIAKRRYLPCNLLGFMALCVNANGNNAARERRPEP